MGGGLGAMPLYQLNMIKISLLLFLALSSFLFAQINIPEISPEVKTVESFGYWQNNSDDGNYRLIILSGGFEHVKNFVFIQLIKNDLENGFSVLDSVSISEINNASCFIVSDFHITQERTFYLIEFNLLNTYSLEKSNLFIKLNFNSYQIVNK